MNKLIALALLCLLPGTTISQKNFGIMRHTFDRHMTRLTIAINEHDTCRVDVYFDSNFDTAVVRAAAALLTDFVPQYACTFRGFRPLYQPPPNQGKLVRDPLKQPVFGWHQWYPKNFAFILFSNAEDMNLQKILPGWPLNPAIGAFTETIEGKRYVVPYTGDWSLFAEVLEHEVAHIFYVQYLTYCQELAHDQGLSTLPNFVDTPTWFEEGYAENLFDRIGNQGRPSFRTAQLNYVNHLRALNQTPVHLDELDNESFYNYSAGWSFLHSVPVDSFQYILQQFSYRNSFTRSWDSALGHSLTDDVRMWRRQQTEVSNQLAYSRPADSLPQREIRTLIRSVGTLGYDHRSNVVVYYRTHDTFGLEVVVTDLSRNRTAVLSHQLADRSWLYRPWNAPAVWNTLAAIVVSREGKDVIELYTVSDGGRKLQVVNRRVIPIPGMMWISDLAFINYDSLLFVGMDARGRQDLYTWSIKHEVLHRLTNDTYAKQYPQALGGDTIAYLVSGAVPDDHYLVLLTPQGKQRVRFGNVAGYADQLKVADHRVALRLLDPPGTTSVITWQNGTRYGYHYRYGTNAPGRTTVSYPLLTNLVGWQDDTLLVATSENAQRELDSWQAVLIDTAALKPLPVAYLPGGGETVPYTSPTPPLAITEADGSLRYRGFMPGGTILRPGLTMTDATGEHGLSAGNLQLGLFGAQGTGYSFSFGRFDLSSRWENRSVLNIGRWPRSRGTVLVVSPANPIVDKWVIATQQYRLPINLEQSFFVEGSIGYFERNLGDSVLPSVSTPLLGVGAGYTSDGMYGNPFIGLRDGSYFSLTANANLGRTDDVYRFTTLRALASYQWCWQPIDFATYLSWKGSVGIASGAYVQNFFAPELAPRPGLLSFDDRSFGTRLLMSELEWRLPLCRLELVPFRFWQARYPLLYLSLTTGWFWVSGSLTNEGSPWQFTNRTGWLLEVSPFPWFSFRYELAAPDWISTWGIKTEW